MGIEKYVGTVKQTRDGISIFVSGTLLKQTFGEAQDSKYLYVVKLKTDDYKVMEQLLESIQALERKDRDPGYNLWETAKMMQEKFGYVRINGPEGYDGIFLRTPHDRLDKFKDLQGVTETLEVKAK